MLFLTYISKIQVTTIFSKTHFYFYYSKNGAQIRDLRRLGQGSQDDPEHPEAQALQEQGQADPTQQVRPRPGPRGLRVLPLRAPRPGVVEDLQGQAVPQVLEEEDRVPRQGQEEEGGDVQRPPSPEKGRQISLFINLNSKMC